MVGEEKTTDSRLNEIEIDVAKVVSEVGTIHEVLNTFIANIDKRLNKITDQKTPWYQFVGVLAVFAAFAGTLVTFAINGAVNPLHIHLDDHTKEDGIHQTIPDKMNMFVLDKVYQTHLQADTKALQHLTDEVEELEIDAKTHTAGGHPETVKALVKRNESDILRMQELLSERNIADILRLRGGGVSSP